jgi:hypothetical protein
MISRREIVTGGMWGSLAAGAAVPHAEEQSADALTVQKSLGAIQSTLTSIRTTLQDGLVNPGLAAGHVGRVRDALTVFLRGAGRFPEFCDIGANVFYDVYDWHIKYAQPIQLSRTADNRLAIQFMFTQLILRWENEPNFVGVPYERQ